MAAGLFFCSAVAFCQNGASSMPPAMAHSRSAGEGTPRVELFLGYSYLRAVPVLEPGNRMEWLNGGSTSIAFNLNRYFGLVGDFGGFDATELELTGAGAKPSGVNNASGTALTYLAGPRLSFRKYDRITPFAQVLFGGIHASAVTLSGCTGVLCTPLPSENALALTAGGGLDFGINRRFAIRAIQAEYLMTRFADLSTGYRQTQNDLRISSGLVLRFGNLAAPLPLAYSCTATPASVYPGDPVTVSGSALNLNPRKTATYSWTGDHGAISGATGTLTIETAAAAPGTYRVTGHISESRKPTESAECSATYTVMAFQPPTVSCSASPSKVLTGGTSAITAQGVSPQNRPMTYSYSASQGTIAGSAATATLVTSGVGPGAITVTCTVADDKGQTASSTTAVEVEVQALQAQPPIVTQALCTVRFERDRKRPTRVDNEAKACLDDIALNLQRDPNAKLALVGTGLADQASFPNDAAQRTSNTKDYLVQDKGIEASRILLYVGPGNEREVGTILIPSAAQMDSRGMTRVPGSAR